jgi:hypothetical protein
VIDQNASDYKFGKAAVGSQPHRFLPGTVGLCDRNEDWLNPTFHTLTAIPRPHREFDIIRYRLPYNA